MSRNRTIATGAVPGLVVVVLAVLWIADHRASDRIVDGTAVAGVDVPASVDRAAVRTFTRSVARRAREEPVDARLDIAEAASLGTAASHGCVRMDPDDVEDVDERIDVGTPILVG
ncbi:L,D-transpeptidase [Patulibacter sp. NPDC049589]|uniref:L,D-transpeptidase n=1 Tax=Patulibacter sp. NPDC049589 TaxID=3154731 RepID=UPI00344A095F